MKKIIINENQKGFLFKNGKFVKLLSAGRYWQFGDRVIEVVNLSSPIFSLRCGVETLLEYPEVKACASVAEVSDRQIALHFVNGKFERVLPCGKYGFWAEQDRHTYQWVDITSPEVDPAVPAYVFSKSPLYILRRWRSLRIRRRGSVLIRSFSGFWSPVPIISGKTEPRLMWNMWTPV